MINLNSLEIHVTNTCNLSCKGCCHLSPIDKTIIDTNKIVDSVNCLSNYVHVDVIRLLGGEPLLYKGLRQLSKQIKESNIASKISISTNGLLLPKMDESEFDYFDEMEISIYNYEIDVKDAIKEYAKKLSTIKNIKIYLYEFEYFRMPYCETPIADNDLINKIFKTCVYANVWQCYNIYDGYLFKCPQSFSLAKQLNSNFDYDKIGIKIEHAYDIEDRIERYINSSEPLDICEWCLGSVGKLMPIKQVSRSKWREYQKGNALEFVDVDFINKLESCLPDKIDTKTIKKIICVKDGMLNEVI